MLSGLGDIGLNVLLWLFIMFVFSMVLIVVPLTSLVLLCFLLFSLGFLIFSNLLMNHPEGSELDAALSIIYENNSFAKNNCSAL